MKKIKLISVGKCRLFVGVICAITLNLLPLKGQNIEYKRYSSSTVENSEAYKEGNVYQKDLLLFVDILKKCHPAFAPGQDAPFNIDSLTRVGYQWASKCQSDLDLKIYIQFTISLLNDGHTCVLLGVDYNLLYPFAYFKDNQNLYLRGVNNEYATSLGKQIIQINGHPVLEVINSFRKSFSCDNELCYLDRIKNHINVFSVWENNPYRMPDSSLVLTFSDATTLSLHPIKKKNLNIAWLQPKKQSNSIRQPVKLPFQYKLLPDKKICYLQFDACTDQSTLRYQYFTNNSSNKSEEVIEKEVSQLPRFDTFVNEMFQAIEANRIKTLVVDVRNNGGGNSMLCDVLLSWLKPSKEIKGESGFIRTSEFWEQHYPALVTDYKKALSEKQQPYEIGKLYDGDMFSCSTTDKNEVSTVNQKIAGLFQKNTEENMIFKGNVVFIQGASTYSSAGMLITRAKDNRIGIVIGSKSTYRPCNYGDLLAWQLPNTKIKGFVSHKIFNRADISKCNELSLVPDVCLEPTWKDVEEGKDICWDWILEHYGK